MKIALSPCTSMYDGAQVHVRDGPYSAVPRCSTLDGDADAVKQVSSQTSGHGGSRFSGDKGVQLPWLKALGREAELICNTVVKPLCTEALSSTSVERDSITTSSSLATLDAVSTTGMMGLITSCHKPTIAH